MVFHINNNNEEISKKFGTDAIFHYTNKAIVIEEILAKYKFKFSSFQNANDPFEYYPNVFGAGTWDEATDDPPENGVPYFYPKTSEKLPEIVRLASDFKKENSAYLSFCSNDFTAPDHLNYGWAKLRMWAQYGDNLRGACLVFSKEKLTKQIVGIYPKGNYEIFSDDIDYLENYLERYIKNSSIPITPETYKNKKSHEIVWDYMIGNYHKLYFRKINQFCDESEFRVILLSKKSMQDEELKFDIGDSLIGVLLGDKFPEVYKPTLVDLCSKKKLSCGKLKWVMGNWQYIDWNE